MKRIALRNTTSKILFAITTLLINNHTFGMERPAEKPTIRLYNLASRDLSYASYSKDKDGNYSRTEQPGLILTQSDTPKSQTTPLIIDLNKEWFIKKTTQAEKVFPTNKLPKYYTKSKEASSVLYVNEIIKQQLQEKPWLKDRSLIVLIVDAEKSYLDVVSIMFGSKIPNVKIIIGDESPETNNGITKYLQKFVVTNPKANEFSVIHYSYNQDLKRLIFKKQKTVKGHKSEEFNINKDDVLLATENNSLTLPYFKLPKTDPTTINITALVTEKLKNIPYLNEASLLITVNDIPTKNISITKAESTNFYQLGGTESQWYDITAMRTNAQIVPGKTVNRVLYFNKNKEELSSSNILKNARDVIFLIPNNQESDEFWKLSNPSMKAIEQLLNKRTTTLPVEVVSLTWQKNENNEAIAANLANLINENYANEDKFKNIAIIDHGRSGNIANIATASLTRPLETIYQIFTPSDKTPYQPQSDKFKTFFNFYVDSGKEALPAPQKGGRVIYIATSYLNGTATEKNITPLLQQLPNILSFIQEKYKYNNNLGVIINDAQPEESFVFIKKEEISSDPAKQKEINTEIGTSLVQLKLVNEKYPAGLGKKIVEELGSIAEQAQKKAAAALETAKEYTAKLLGEKAPEKPAKRESITEFNPEEWEFIAEPGKESKEEAKIAQPTLGKAAVTAVEIPQSPEEVAQWEEQLKKEIKENKKIIAKAESEINDLQEQIKKHGEIIAKEGTSEAIKKRRAQEIQNAQKSIDTYVQQKAQAQKNLAQLTKTADFLEKAKEAEQQPLKPEKAEALSKEEEESLKELEEAPLTEEQLQQQLRGLEQQAAQKPSINQQISGFNTAINEIDTRISDITSKTQKYQDELKKAKTTEQKKRYLSGIKANQKAIENLQGQKQNLNTIIEKLKATQKK